MLSIYELQRHTDGVVDADGLVSDFDDALDQGFGRLGGEHVETLHSIRNTFTGTPLETRLEEAREAVSQSAFEPDVFEAFAAARASLQGARYDALVARADDVFGWQRRNFDATDAEPLSDDVQSWLQSTRQWLLELAVAGFGGLDEETIVPFDATLDQLQSTPRTFRLASLLTGFRNEMLAQTPTARIPKRPTRRWGDLWSRAMLHAGGPPERPDTRTVSGTFRPLGVDLNHHDNNAGITVYGLLDDGESLQFVRTSRTAYKVDVVVGDDLWELFARPDDPLLEAIGRGREIELDEATLTSSGDLHWDDRAELGDEFDMLEVAEAHFAPDADSEVRMPTLAPLDRHPVQMALPMYLEDYGVDRETDGLPEMVFESGVRLPVDVERISPYSELVVDHVLGSKRMFALLRFDGGQWSAQPLVETKRSKLYYTGMEADEDRHSTVASKLRNRADQLLREKA